MKFAYERAEEVTTDWRESLPFGVDLRLPNFFNIERLIDKAEKGEWSGLWW